MRCGDSDSKDGGALSRRKTKKTVSRYVFVCQRRISSLYKWRSMELESFANCA